jgi:hypothetical protein
MDNDQSCDTSAIVQRYDRYFYRSPPAKFLHGVVLLYKSRFTFTLNLQL